MTQVYCRESWDCGVAALAMATGRTYEFVMQRFRQLAPELRNQNLGVSPEEMSRYLFSERVVHHVVDVEANEEKELGTIHYTMEEISFLRSKGRYRVLFGVTKEESPEKGHWLYWSGNNLYDPAPSHGYLKCEKLNTHVAILIPNI